MKDVSLVDGKAAAEGNATATIIAKIAVAPLRSSEESRGCQALVYYSGIREDEVFPQIGYR